MFCAGHAPKAAPETRRTVPGLEKGIRKEVAQAQENELSKGFLIA